MIQQATGEAHSLGGALGDLVRRDCLERRARTGTVQRPPVIGLRAPHLPAPPHAAVIQFDFEEDTLRELHRLPAVEEQGISDRERRRRVQVLAARRERLLSCSRRSPASRPTRSTSGSACDEGLCPLGALP